MSRKVVKKSNISKFNGFTHGHQLHSKTGNRRSWEAAINKDSSKRAVSYEITVEVSNPYMDALKKVA